MPQLLHILTKPDDELAQKTISQQRTNLENKIEIVDASKGTPDYKELVRKIFAADSVQVW